MMRPEERAAELRGKLDHHAHLYYTEASPEISDSEYDALFREARRRAPRAASLHFVAHGDEVE